MREDKTLQEETMTTKILCPKQVGQARDKT